MQGLKATALIFATAAFAWAATAPAYAGGHQTATGTEAQQLRWDAIAAQGRRFQEQRENKPSKPRADSKNFMAMAMAAREAR